MTIDEAIKHCEEVAEHEEWMYISELQTTVKCTGEHGKCAADHRQLAEWLKELKEAKRLLKAAVEDFELIAEVKDCSVIDISKYKWRYADEVKKLLKD